MVDFTILFPGWSSKQVSIALLPFHLILQTHVLIEYQSVLFQNEGVVEIELKFKRVFRQARRNEEGEYRFPHVNLHQDATHAEVANSLTLPGCNRILRRVFRIAPLDQERQQEHDDPAHDRELCELCINNTGHHHDQGQRRRQQREWWLDDPFHVEI